MGAAAGATEVERRISELAPWFHNLHLPDGSQTAPDHPLGDFPAFKWNEIESSLPEDLSGWSVLDIGCNAGFYSFELARRGGRVLGIDHDEHYLTQAGWAAEVLGLQERTEFRRMGVYELAHLDASFDLVIFMGVLYHLRHPLLALDIVAEKVDRTLVFQTLTMPGNEVIAPPEDVTLDERDILLRAGWPKMAFIEHALAGDPTNWWAPDVACVEAMLRSSGLHIEASPAHEIYLCSPCGNPLESRRHSAEVDAATNRSASGR